MGVAPAGVTAPNTGHHHLLIDVAELPPDNLPIPNDATHKHFGAGQTETELALEPGKHTLQLVLGDAAHIPHQPPVRSEKITITVVSEVTSALSLGRMDIRNDFVDAVGNTPLIKLRRASELTGCTILGKAEFLNPGGSVKDRAAKFMVLDAERRGVLEPGGLIVEGTAGNTGIGLALVGRSRGYRTLILMPNTQSQEKKDMLRLCGAELREVPAVPYKDPNNYVHIAARTAKELEATEPHGVLYANQWDNPANRDGHAASTGPEIWEQTDGKVDGFICAVGTGGTLAGVSAYLKHRNPRIVTAAADPMGAPIYSWIKTGELKGSAGSSDQRGHRPGTCDRQPRRRQDRRRYPDSRRAKCCRCCTTCFSTKACCWAARPASTWRAPSAWRSSSVRARRS